MISNSGVATAQKKTSAPVYPKDWPKDGPIDLTIHDLPHASSTIEWWYMNSHIIAEDGREFSLFASFFRRLLEYDEKQKKFNYGHSITWAIYDAKGEKYYPVSLVDKVTPKIGLEKIEKGEIIRDHRLRKAVKELLQKGNVPYPDQLIREDVRISEKNLDLYIDGNTYKKRKNGTYDLSLFDEELQVGCKVNFAPLKKPVRHGDNGVVKGVSAEDMFYYFIPRCRVTGTLQIGKEKFKIKKASGWYDHEFGRPPENKKKKKETMTDVAWNWMSVQLDNGYEVSAYDLFDLSKNNKNSVGRWAIVIVPKGTRRSFS